ncbi:helix-turn-helix transcriptional regulator [Stenotrophomonas rhizophila]|uniref:helix-turn-helix transcriptional regulator n=1 Tax=Stenotrophomonas rhizophila TaxID=216778 RepID=UPI00119EC7D4|nr:AlpA family phage regulatory protein [Stenotrophomonas rhizophila]
MGAAELIPEVQLRLEQLEAQTGMKKSYIYREMAKGTFPRAQKIGGCTRWHQSDVQRWIEAMRTASSWHAGQLDRMESVDGPERRRI